ncbi:hypothetical protein [Nocardia sp. CA-135398]|uniref:hypothetical protein n=1 Tax=Nocardia sp. CA-135398 TaxID=3239977 RepID=UPI003D95C793
MNSALGERVMNEVCVSECAAALGYQLVRMVVRDPSKVDDPVARLINTARGYNVAAVIIPSLDHVGGDPGEICGVCDVVTARTQQTYVCAAAPVDAPDEQP